MLPKYSWGIVLFILYILTDFLLVADPIQPILSVNWCAHCNCGFAYFSFWLCQYLCKVFWGSVVQQIHIYNCNGFLACDPFLTLCLSLSLVIFFALRSTLSDIDMDNPAVLISVYISFFHDSTFSPLTVLNLKFVISSLYLSHNFSNQLCQCLPFDWYI